MNNRKAKQVKTPTLAVQRTVVGVADHVHAKALQRIEDLTVDRDALFRMTESDTDTILALSDKTEALHSQINEAKAFRFVKAVIAWGIGFGTGVYAGAYLLAGVV